MEQAQTTYKVRSIRYLLLLVLLVWAASSSIARYFLSDISHYKTQIEQLVADKTPYQLSITEIKGRWLIFSPLFELKGITLYSRNNSEYGNGYEEEYGDAKEDFIIKIDHIAVEVDIIESIFTLSLRVKQLLIDGVDLTLLQEPANNKVILKGLALDPDSKVDTQELVRKLLDDFILTSEQIYLNNVRIGLALEKISKGQLEISALTLDNEWFNHELAAYLILQDGSEIPRNLRFSSVFQGNPLVLNEFSARSFVELEGSELGFWFEKINIPKLSVPDISLGLQTWFEIKRGILEDTSLVINVADIKVIQENLQATTHQIESLSMLLSAQAGVEIGRLHKKEYLSSLRNQKASLKIRNLDLDWDDLHINNFSALFEQKNVLKLTSPLKRQWHDFEEASPEILSQQSSSRSKAIHQDSIDNVLLYRALFSHIPLSLIKKISPFISALEPQQEKINEASPHGSLKDLQIAIFFQGEKNPEIYASGYARNLGISSVAKVPAITGIDFYAELAPSGLGIELNTEGAKIAEDFNLFRKDLIIEKATGNLFLERLSGDIVVHSDIVDLKNSWIEASASFALSIPERYYTDGEKEIPAWSLQANIKSIPAVDALMFFPGKLPPSFLDWLDNFLLSGSVKGDVMLFAFAKKREPDTFSLLDGDLNLVGGELDYLPGKWPVLSDVNGHILVHNDQVKVNVPAASMFDSRLYNASVFIPSYLTENLPRVKVQGNVSGSLQDVQKLFLESELKYSLGSVVEDWVLYGSHNASVNIDLPISDSPNNYESKLEVDMSVDDALIAVPSVGLGVKELSSDVHYSMAEGLTANAIKAKFFDKEVQGRITTLDATGNQVIQIFAEGDINSEDLSAWQEFWVFDNLQGSSHFNAIIAVGEIEAIEAVLPTISKKEDIVPVKDEKNKKSKKQKEKPLPEIQDEPVKAQASIVRVDIMSDLENLSITLPGSYAKNKTEVKATRLQLDVFPESMIYRLDYGTRLGVSAKTIGDDFERARIHFGEGSFVLPAEAGVTVTGHIDELDFDTWLAYFEKNLFDEDIQSTSEKNLPVDNIKENKSKDTMEEQYDPASVLNRMELSIANFFGFDQTLTDLKIKVTREPFVWHIELENETLAGIIYVPDEDLIGKDNPIVANLKYLKLSEEQFASGESSTKIKDSYKNTAKESQSSSKKNNEELIAESEELKPDDFSFMKLDIANVTLDKAKHGRWQLDIFPDENGVDFKIHQLNYGLMAINGSGRWDYREDYSATRFKGHLRTSAITKIFSALSLRPSSKSKGLMAIDIKWPGSPFDFDSDTMKGTAGLEIFDGSIIEVDINSKKFRALGIFNLGVITDVLTLRIFKKIGKGIEEALTGSDDENKDAELKQETENKIEERK